MQYIDVTEAEGRLLEVLWRLGPLPPPRFLREVKQERAWSDSTIKTLLARLMRKGLISSEKQSKLTVYRPLINRETFQDWLVDELVARVFDGDRSRLAEFLATRALSPDG